MKTFKCTIIWGWMIIWGLTVGLNSLSFAAPVEGTHASIADSSDSEHDTDKEMDRFLKAKEQVFKRNWEKARSGFESYLKDYPQGRLRDEGLYWLASSLNMLSKDEKREENIIALRKQSLGSTS
jgi:TolA-binding protein